jgi:hypothetical protein
MAALSQLITDLQTRFRDVGGGFISAVPATLYLNLGCEDFANYVEPQWREYGFFVTAKQYRYVLPTEFLHTMTMMWYQNGQYEIPYLSPQEFKSRGYMNRRISVSTPQAYTIINNELYLGPAPGTTSSSSLLTTTTLAANGTSMTVTDATKFQSPAGLVLIDSEQIPYQANDGVTQLSLLKRGEGGTAAAQHLSGATVFRMDMVMTYSYSHKYLSATTDAPSFQTQYHRTPVHYAMYLALKQDGRDKQAAEELQIYTQKRLEARREIRMLTRDKNNRRISTAYL